jgi:hypothetical protein
VKREPEDRLRDLVAANGGELRMTEEQIFEEFDQKPEPSSARAVVSRLQQAGVEMKPAVSARGEHEMTLRLPAERLNQEDPAEKNRTYLGEAAQRNGPRRFRKRRLRKRILLGIGIAATIAVAGFGVWYFAIRDTGPSAAEEATARAAAAAAQCQQQVGALLSAEEDLDGRLSGSGMTEDDYISRVGDVSAAYREIPIKDLQAGCLTSVGIPTESAMNAYIDASNTWNDCVTDFSCNVDSIKPDLQSKWAKATVFVNQAKQGLTSLEPTP